MAIPLGSTATNPQTGHQIILTAHGWVDAGTQQMNVPDTDQQAIQGLQKQVQDAQYLAQKSQQFIDGMNPQKEGQGSFATGPAYISGVHIPFTHSEVPNPLQAIVGARDPRMGQLESITNQAWVHMRPEGSGAVRGYEATDFKEAFPGVQHWGQENQGINARLQQDAAIATQKLAFIDAFIRAGRGSYAQANAAWAQQFGNGVPQRGPQMPGPPMQMQPNPQSPIGASPQPGGYVPPPQQQTPQQQLILQYDRNGNPL